jgi:hypothetical protein
MRLPAIACGSRRQFGGPSSRAMRSASARETPVLRNPMIDPSPGVRHQNPEIRLRRSRDTPEPPPNPGRFTRPAASCCTYPSTGPGNRPGKTSTTPSAKRPTSRLTPPARGASPDRRAVVNQPDTPAGQRRPPPKQDHLSADASPSNVRRCIRVQAPAARTLAAPPAGALIAAET